MKKYQITPGFINLEITETAFVESGEMLQENMIKLRQMGCSFSMDDFGTGYSNLSRMAEVVYNLVKLDKSLIWPCFITGSDAFSWCQTPSGCICRQRLPAIICEWFYDHLSHCGNQKTGCDCNNSVFKKSILTD